MSLIKIEKFEQADTRKLMDIYRESNLENVGYFYPDCTDAEEGLRRVEENFLTYIREEFLSCPGNVYYVLEKDNVWVSALRLYHLEGHFYYVEALETRQEHRGRGYASELFRAVFEELKQRGSFVIRDSVSKRNEASLAVHKSCGFQIVLQEAYNYVYKEAEEHCYGMEYRYVQKG